MKHVVLAVLTFLGCIPDPLPRVVPEAAAGVPSAVSAARVATAAGFVAGTIQEIETDPVYDDPCRPFRHMLMGCDGTVTYRLRVVRPDGSGKYLWVFVPATGTMPLTVGMAGTFVYFRVTAWRYQECAQHQALTAALCSADNLPAVVAQADIYRLEDSTWVQAILQ